MRIFLTLLLSLVVWPVQAAPIQKRFAVILVTFPDLPAPQYGNAASVTNTWNAFMPVLEANAYHTLDASFDVFSADSPIVMGTKCPYTYALTEGKKIVAAQLGLTLLQYSQRYQHTYAYYQLNPNTTAPHCTGSYTVGADVAVSGSQFLEHECGHACYGLGEGTGLVGCPACVSTAYNGYDVMAQPFSSHQFSVPTKLVTGLLGTPTTPPITRATVAGRYTVEALDEDQTLGSKGVEVCVPSTTRCYYAEFRKDGTAFVSSNEYQTPGQPILRRPIFVQYLALDQTFKATDYAGFMDKTTITNRGNGSFDVSLDGAVPPIPPQPPAPNGDVLTYAGGVAEDLDRDVIEDAAGNLWVTGGTASAPTVTGDPMNVWLRKYAPTGQLLCQRVFGGPNYDRAYAIEMLPSGDPVVAGRAGLGFPVTAGKAQTTFGGDNNVESLYGAQDGFVAAFNADCTVKWSTYLGGPGKEIIRDIAVNASGIYAEFSTVYSHVPWVPANALRPRMPNSLGDGLIARLSLDGATILGATYIGGSGADGGVPTVRVNNSGVYAENGSQSTDVATTANAAQRTYGGGIGDILITKFALDLSAIVYQTYLGGSGQEGQETHHGELLSDGSFVASVYTQSTNWPVKPGAYRSTACGGNDFGIVVIAPNGQSLTAGTYICTTRGDAPEGVAVTSDDRIVVTGSSQEASYPVTPDAMQTGFGGGDRDGVLSVFSRDLKTLLYSTHLGGNAEDRISAVTRMSDGRIAYVGYTSSSNFPVLSGAQQPSYGGGLRDGFFGILTLPGPAPPNPCTVTPPKPTVTVSEPGFTYPAWTWAGTRNDGCPMMISQ